LTDRKKGGMMDYSKWYTRMIHTSNYRKQLRKEQKMEATEKQQLVISILQNNIDLPTKEVMKEYEELWEGRDTVSERYVQRIRKWFKSNQSFTDATMKDVKGGKMDKEVFDTGKGMFDWQKGMFDWQINVLNLANEGGWTIQQIASKLDLFISQVKETIKTFEYMIHTEELYDEDSDTVFLKPNDDLFKDPEPSQNRSASGDDYWEVKIDCVSACGKVEQSVDVFMSKKAREKAMMFMKWAKKCEWLAYLIGEKKDDGYYVYDLYLPDQRTSSTLVDKVVAENYNQMIIVGVIHSHHDMGAGDADKPSFSGHDAEFINGNHNLSLLAGNKREGGFKIVGIGRVKTPCGAFMRVKAHIKAMFEESEEEASLKNEFFGKVLGRESKMVDNGDNGGYHFTKNPTLTR
jgi:hypothetical protein